jgi:hypothetical protein
MKEVWTCLACERANWPGSERCLGCARTRAVATDHAIWDKCPPRHYITIDAVIAAKPRKEV